MHAYLPSGGGHSTGENDDTSLDRLFFEDRQESVYLREYKKDLRIRRWYCVLPHCFYTHTSFIREEYENLIGRVCARICEKVQLVAAMIQSVARHIYNIYIG